MLRFEAIFIGKANILWKGHKILKTSYLFWLQNFCALLWKSELTNKYTYLLIKLTCLHFTIIWDLPTFSVFVHITQFLNNPIFYWFGNHKSTFLQKGEASMNYFSSYFLLYWFRIVGKIILPKSVLWWTWFLISWLWVVLDYFQG